MRGLCLSLVLLLVPGAALAWEAGRDGRLCTLSHSADGGDVLLTHDPAAALYAITLTRPVPWPEASVFGMVFDGARPLRITTTRHDLSEDGRALTVTDTGFGNVLDGLESNSLALAITGDAALALDLTGAAPAVAAFRACSTVPSA